MLEHHHEPIIPFARFFLRLVKNFCIALLIVFFALSVGIFGYHSIEGLSWVDAILNASMILGGMGPVNELHTTTGKLFASFYALFSGLIFMVVAGLLFAPILHRFLHRFHLDASK